jgi:hypothetical protein
LGIIIASKVIGMSSARFRKDQAKPGLTPRPALT